MINKIAAFLHEAIPDDIAEKALSKIDPKMKRFFSNSIKSGIGAGGALTFLRNRFENPSIESEKQRLSSRAKSGVSRPDEQAAAHQIQDNEKRASTLRKGTTAGLALAGGAGALGSLGGILGSAKKNQLPQMPHQEMDQPQPLTRQEALQRFNDRNKKKKSNLMAQTEMDIAAQQSQSGQGSNIERLIQLLQQRKQGMR